MNDQAIIKKKPRGNSGKKMQKNVLLFLLIVLLILIAVPYYFLSNLREEEYILRTYRYAQVKTRTFVRRLTAAGSVQVESINPLRTKVSGTIIEMFVERGQFVEKGDKVAIIAAPQLEEEKELIKETIENTKKDINDLELEQAMEKRRDSLTLADLKEKLKNAQDNLNLQQQLFDLGTISRNELNNAKAALRTAERELENTKEQVKLKEEKFEFDSKILNSELTEAQDKKAEIIAKMAETTLIAPVSGLIIQIPQEEGAIVQEETTVLKIADMDSSIIKLNLKELDVARIERGQEAKVQLAGKVVTGIVSFISPEIVSTSDGPAVEVKVALEEIPAGLKANASATVEFELSRRDNISYLPRAEYLTSGEYSFVYVIENDKAVRKNVSFGQHDGNYVEISSGLEEGDKVIISSYEEFKEKLEIPIIKEGGRLY